MPKNSFLELSLTFHNWWNGKVVLSPEMTNNMSPRSVALLRGATLAGWNAGVREAAELILSQEPDDNGKLTVESIAAIVLLLQGAGSGTIGERKGDPL